MRHCLFVIVDEHWGEEIRDSPGRRIVRQGGTMNRAYHTPVQYTWTLAEGHPIAYRPSGYQFGFAEPADAPLIASVLTSAPCVDPRLSQSPEHATQEAIQCIRAALRTGDTDYILARSGRDVVAAAAVTNLPRQYGHLPNGISVLPEHANRGAERYLLYLALLWLREMGVTVARAYAEAGSILDRKTYPSLNGRRHGIAYGVRRHGARRDGTRRVGVERCAGA